MAVDRRRSTLLALALAAALPLAAHSQGTTVGDATARQVAEREQIAVIELSGDYDQNLPNGEVNDDPRQAIAREFFRTHADEYDFVILWTTFDFAMEDDVLAFCRPVRNDVQGIGMPVFDDSALFGSSHRLQASIDMALLSRWAMDPLHPDFEKTLGVLGHEILHRWVAHVRFRMPDGSLSSALLGKDGSHWSYLLDTDASLEYGADWQDNGDGTFTARAIRRFWSPLDLYLAGFYEPGQVPPFFLIENPAIDPLKLPELNVTIQGTKRVITVDDVVGAEGVRVPSAQESQKEYRAAFILVTRPGEPVTDAQIQGLNRVRRELSTRFSALTGGRGLLDVEPQAVPGRPGEPGTFPGGGTPREPGTPASIAEGLAWLRGEQKEDGHWEDTPATALRDTALAVLTLTALDPQWNPDRKDDAIAWLRGQAAANTDFVARLATVLSKASSGSTARASLLALQNADGGWGVGAGYGSDPVDTALAVLALTSTTPSSTEAAAVARAATLLESVRNADGGWGNGQGGASRTTATATVLRALRAAGRTPAASSLTWLASRQNQDDGGFGDSPSTIHDTANALDALIALQELRQVDGATASAYLGSRQSQEGGWDNSVYNTALALSTLKRFNFPNWSFTGTPGISPQSPRDGQRVRLTLQVVNDGNAPAPAGVLRLYEGDPAQGGQPAAADVALPAMAPAALVTVTVSWDSLDKPGPRTLYAVIDPAGATQELSKSDNRLPIEIVVQDAPALADLEVQPEDITFSPAQPLSIPVDLSVSVTVRNVGHADAPAVAVRLLNGPPGSGTLIEEKTVAVPGRSSAVVNFVYTLTTPGITTFSVVVDPADAVPEAEEGNNAASKDISTGPRLDLAVSASDLSVTGVPILGNDLLFKAVLHNRGTVDAPAATVTFVLKDGATALEIGRSTIQLGISQSAERTATWRIDREGSFQLEVTIDPAGLVPDGDRTNNQASLSFSTGSSAQPNVVLASEGLTFEPNPGLQGQPVTLRAVVRNAGSQPLSNVEVGFYEGNPAQGGTLLGDLQVVPSLAAGESATVSITLPPLATPSSHLIFAMADPRNQLAELSEEDNAGFQTLPVLSFPDLALTAGSIRVEPVVPRPGQAVTVFVDVTNTGQQEARNVVVRLTADGQPAGSDAVLPSVTGGSIVRASFAWTFPAAGGTVRLAAVADPDGAIAEGSESNNATERTVTGVDANDPVAPRYFSPNGDGVQDTTSMGLVDPLPAGSAVEVWSASGKLVRRAAGSELGGGVFVWDGRDDVGRVVRDGDYTLALVAPSGVRLREGVARVDMDRSPLLDAVGTPFEKITNLTCDRPASNVQIPTNDDRFYFQNTAGIFRGSANGKNVERVVQASYPFRLEVSRGGEWLAFSDDEGWWGDKKYARADGTGLTTIPIQSHAGSADFGFRGDTQDLVYLETTSNYTDTPKIRVRPLDGSGPDRVAGQVPTSSGSYLFSSFYQISPDGRFLIFGPCVKRLCFCGSDGCTDRRLRLLDLISGQIVILPVDMGGVVSWSPDGRRFALARYYDVDDNNVGGEVLIFDTAGRLERTFRVPRENYASLPFYRQFGEVTSTSVDFTDVQDIFRPSWSSTGESFAFGVLYSEVGDHHYVEFGRLFRADVATGGLTTVAWLEPNLSLWSFHVSTWDGSQWVERGVLHYSSRYADRQLDLAPYLPDAAGEYKVRIRQAGRDGANVDRVRLLAGAGEGRELAPSAASVSGQDVLGLVTRFDREVLDLHEREMELRWSDVTDDMAKTGLRLSLVAREEGPEVRNALPFEYPAQEDGIYNVVAGQDGGLVVDGQQTAGDDLGEPLFAEWTRPDTGHPPAVVYGYAKSDGSFLYAALDFTVDNTAEGERDWASLVVDTPQGPRELRITSADRQWGTAGFTRTGKVGYTHKYYEWKVPLAEIGAAAGDTLSLRFQAYGSAGELSPTTFLPTYGYRPIWMPGEDTLLFWEEGSGSTWAVPLDGGEPRRIFDRFGTFASAALSMSGHKLLFQDNRDVIDPQSDCYSPYVDASTFSFESRANLTAQLSGSQAEDGRGIVLEGTAADLNLARWRLEYAYESSPNAWIALGPDSGQPVFDDVFTTWLPPAAGAYLVRLTVEDQAGNVRRTVRRFVTSSPGGATIADATVSPRTFSPNGDGVLDTATLSYRVLAPVHLEVHVDSLRGGRLRTFRRDHAVTGNFEIVWDGRDDRGMLVPDGTYRIVVQGLYFAVDVDTTPPQVSAALAGPLDSIEIVDLATGEKVSYVDVNPKLVTEVMDRSRYSQTLEIGTGASPSSWSPFAAAFLDLEHFVNRKFRLQAQDVAGNRNVTVSAFGAEQLIVDGFGSHLAADGSLAPLGLVPVSKLMTPPADFGTVRFAAAESVRPRLSQVFVQFRPEQPVDAPWQNNAPLQILDASGAPTAAADDHRFQVVWSLAGIQPGIAFRLRLRATDELGREVISNELRFGAAGGLQYRGLDDVENLWAADWSKAVAAARLTGQRVLWGVNTLPEALADVRLILTSSDDPRFAAGRVLPLAASSGKVLVFDGRELLPCKTYKGFIVALTAPAAGQPRPVESNSRKDELPCIDLAAGLEPIDSQCGDGPTDVRRLSLVPKSPNGVALRLLTVALSSPDNVIQSVNVPLSGKEYTFDFDTRSLGEGEHKLYLRLTNGEGEEVRKELTLPVDRTPPTAVLTYPPEGRLCKPPGNIAIPIEGTLADTGVGAFYGVFVLSPPLGKLSGGSFNSTKQGRLAELTGEFAGNVQLHLEVADSGGSKVCVDRTFFYDGALEGAVVAGDQPLISPNGDGFVDAVRLSYGASEPAVLTLRILAPDGSPVRTLLSDLQVPAPGVVVWNGFRDDGTVAPDGRYKAVARFTDGCGNVGEAFTFVEVDNTPPAVAISAPQPGATLPMLVQVLGSATDPHFLEYQVDFGVGAQPFTWSPVGQGSSERQAQPLAVWNTYGLTGVHTLRLTGRDQAGNVGQTAVTLDLSARDALLANLEAVPDLISPNGDGRRDGAALRFGLTAEAQATLQVVSAQGAVLKTLLSSQTLPAGAAVRPWDGLGDDGQPVADGDYRVRVRAVATTGAPREQEEIVPLSIDRQAPVFDLARPRGGFASSASGVVGSVRDPHLVGWSISLTSMPDAPLWTEIGRGTTVREDALLAPLANLEEGEYALLLAAADGAENRTEEVVRFTLDDTPPEVSLTAPAPQAVVGAGLGAVAVSGTVKEDHLSSWRLEVGAGTSPSSWSSVASGTSLPASQTLAAWSVAGLADGVYTLRLTAEDLAGATAQATVAVVVDNTPPAAVIAQPSGGFVTGSTTVTGTADDAHLLQYRLEVAPEGTQQWSELGRSAARVVSGNLFAWQNLPPDGRYQLRLRVDDQAGNSSVAAATVTVDRRPPAAPQGLTATLENGRDARLSWQANTEPDLAGYFVYRQGVKVNAAPVVNPAYLDAGLLDGTFDYTVTAVDDAGQESLPSAPARVLVDLTGPAVLLHRPTAGSRVGGLVDVVVSVSATDLAEYRLYVGLGDGSSGRQLLRRSTTTAAYETAAQWLASGLPEDALYTLRLEAEDVRGNVAVVESAVTIDNLPPATPTGLAASVSVADATLTWVKNTEADLLGYLLYRDGRLVNAAGPAVGDLRDYALQFAATAAARYIDKALPDGTFRYTIAAIDRAGNVSGPSAPVTVTLNRRAPRATIVDPDNGARVDRTVYVLATTPDQDVSRVLFQVRADSSATWTDIGTADTAAPWEASWDPTGLSYGVYRLRAIATDTANQTDSAPPEISVTYTDLERPAVPQGLAARVDGGDVHLSWTANNEADFRGYLVDRVAANGTPVRVTPQPVTGTSLVDAGLADNVYTYTLTAVDTYGNESDPSAGREAMVYTPELDRPFTPTRELTTALAGVVVPGAQVAVVVTPPSGSPVSLPSLTADGEGLFQVASIELARGANAIAVTATDAQGNRSKTATSIVSSGTPPSAPTGLTAAVSGYQVNLAWTANPPAESVVGYRPYRDGAAALEDELVWPFSQVSASSEDSYYNSAGYAFDLSHSYYYYWVPDTSADRPAAGQWIEARWADPLLVSGVRLDWYSDFSYAIDFDLQVWDGGGWLTIVPVRGNTQSVHEVALPAPYRTTGMRLVLRRIAGNDTDDEPVRLSEMEILHQPLVSGTEYTDYNYSGEEAYTLTAVNAYGFESGPSAPALVPPPAPVTLTGSPSGAGAHLDWTASAASDFQRYDLYREGELIWSIYNQTELAHDDAPLRNGTYRYTVRVVNQIGTQSAPSNEAAVTVSVAPPAAPVALTVTAPPSGGELDLAWQPAPGSTPNRYRVLRSAVSGGPYDELALTPDADTTTWRDRGLAEGSTWFYVVDALDEVGNASAHSNEASGTVHDTLAPAAPVLHYPGFPGLPFLSGGTIAGLLVGTAEPGTQVTLLRDGGDVAQAAALAETLIERSGLDIWSALMSPDGESLWIDDYPPQVYRFDTGVSTTVSTSVDSVVRWSATGDRVVFPSYEGSSGLTRLRSFRIADGSFEDLARVEYAELAVPSPDGRRIAFLGDQDGEAGLFVIDLATGAIVRIGGFASWQVDEDSVRWSPDGERFVYQWRYPNTLEIADAADGTTQVVETQPAGWPASWSPDGSELVYNSTADGWEQVWRYRVSDGHKQALTSDPIDHSAPSWSPDGKSVAYVVDYRRLVVRSLETGETSDLLSMESEWGYGTWDNVLTWEKGGRILVLDNGEPVRITPAGRFQATNVALSEGDNAFTGIARDAGGQTGPESQPMVITVEGGDLPDLVVTAGDLSVLPTVPQTGGSASLTAVVRNAGTVASPAAELTLALVRPDGTSVAVADRVAVNPIAPGAAQAISRQVTLPATAGRYSLAASVDPLDLVNEADEGNNQAARPFVATAGEVPALFASTDRPAYAGGEDVRIALEVVNGGPAFTGSLALAIEDAEGVLVEELAAIPVESLAYGETLRREAVWNTGDVFAGSYRVRARLLDATNQPKAEATAAFAIGAFAQVTGAVETDRGAYTTGSTVRITGTVAYRAGNDALTGAEARIQVLPVGSDTPVFEIVRSLGDLLPGSEGSVAVDWPTGATAPGSYRVRLTAERAGQVLTTAETLFELANGPLAVEGSLSVPDRVPSWGSPLGFSLTVRNRGGAALQQLPVRVRILDPAAGTVVGSTSLTVDLPVGAAANREASFDTRTLGLGNRVVVLEADLPAGSGVDTVVLDAASVTVVDRTPPDVAIVAPAAGALLPPTVDAVVTARDGLSPVRRVELSLDGGAWVPLDLRDAVASRYGRAFTALAAGPHTARARATDSWGNVGQTAEVAFTVGGAPRLTASKVAVLAQDADQDGRPSPGDILEYRVTVANEGSSPAAGVAFLDQAPARTQIVAGSVTSTAGTVESDSPVRVAIGDLAASAQVEIRFRVAIDSVVPAGVSAVLNQGAVTSDSLPSVLTDDPTVGGTSDPTVTAITAAPRLSAELTDLLAVDADVDEQPSPGDTLEYQAVLRNTGNTSATSVILTAPIPAHASPVAGSATTTAGSATFDASGLRVQIGELAGGQSATVTFRVKVDSTVPAGVRQVSLQGDLTSFELAAVQTDDPRVGGASDPTVTAITAAPVLTATKTATLYADADENGVASPGDTLLYGVEVVNGGNTSATSVSVNDEIPASTELEAGTVQASQGSVVSEDPIQADLGEVAAGESASVTFRVVIATPFPASQSSVSNQASVTSAELPTVVSDDPSTEALNDATVTTVVAAPVLSATKTAILHTDADGDSQPSPGDVLEYHVTIANTGNTSAAGVAFLDQAPLRTQIVAGSVTASAGTVESDSPVQITIGDLAAAAQVDVRFRVAIDPVVPLGVTSVSNQGAVTSDSLPSVLTDDPAVGGSSDPTVTPITASPRLSAELIDSLAVDADNDGQPSPGDTLEYRAVVRNTGNTSATAVVLAAPIPAHTSHVEGSASSTAGSVTFDATGLRVQIGELAGGLSATVTFRVKIDATVPAGVRQISLQGNVASSELTSVPTDDPRVGGAADPTVTAIVAAPVLTATKTVTLYADADVNGVASPGDTLLYRIEVVNRGNTPATSVNVNDTIPAGTSVEAGTVQASQGTVTSESPVQANLGEIAAGETETVTFRVVIASPLPRSQSSISNQASVTSAELPAVLTDDPSTTTVGDPTVTPVATAPVLSATKTAVLHTDADGDHQPSPGDVLEYRVTIANTGNTSAADVRFVDQIPLRTQVVAGSVTASAGTIESDSPVQITIGDLAASAQVDIRFRIVIDPVVPAGVTSVSNQGAVTSDSLPTVPTDDPAVGGSSDPTVTALTAAPVLTATKTATLYADADDNGVASPGDTLLYRIDVVNGGNTPATSVVVSDTIPTGASVETGSVQASQGSVTSESPVQATLGEIAAGGSASVTFRVVIASPFPRPQTSVSNQASVASAELPAVLTDDPSTAAVGDPTVTPVATSPVLSATKTAVLHTDVDGDNQQSPGDVLEYRITISNTGSAPATGVTFVDQAPGYTLIVPGSVTTSAGTVESDSPVRVTIGELDGSSQVEIRFRVAIDAVVPGGVTTVSNQGSVASAELPAVLTDDPAVGGTADPTVTAITAAPRLTAELTDALAVDADGNGSPSPGDTLEYRLLLRNSGNTSASGIVVTTPIPAYASPVAGSASTTAGTVTDFDAAGLRVAIQALPGGQSATITFRVKVDATVPAGVRQVSLQGTVTSAELAALLTDDPRVGGAADPTVTPITAAPSLTATKTATLLVDADGDTAASPGDTLLYRIEVVNGGNTPATAASLRDPIPAGTAVETGSVQTSQGSVVSEAPVQVDLGEIAAGTSATVSFQVRIASPFPRSQSSVSNQASVTSAELPTVATDDPSTAAADDATVTPVTATPVLSATKTAVLFTDADGDTRPSPGDILEYQVTIANTGNTSATGVSFADSAPTSTWIVPGSVTVSEGTMETESPLQVSIGELAATGQVEIRFQVAIEPVVPAGLTAISNQGAVTIDQLPTVLTDDPAVGGAADPTVTTIAAAPRLLAELTDALFTDADGNGSPSPGDTLEYRAVLRNAGNTSAIAVVLTAPIPAHTSPVPGSAATSAGSVATFDTTGLRVEVGEIAGGQSATVTFRVQVAASVPAGVRQISLQGTVTSDGQPPVLTDDPRLGGAADPTVTSIVASPALTATKAAVLVADADGDGVVSGGDTLLYRIEVANGGNTPATAVAVNDPVPAGTELEAGSVQASQGTVVSTSPIQASLGEIPPNGTATVTFRVRIASPLPAGQSAVSNQASVTSAELPPLASDDPATPAAGDPTVTPVTVTPRISIDGAAGSEGDGSMAFTVRLSIATDHPVTVGWSTADNTAVAGSDYVAAASALTFAPGETVKSLSVNLVNDAVVEPEETFFVRLAGATGGILGTSEAVGIIRDDDTASVRLSIGDTTATEGTAGSSTAVFTVTLSAPSATAVSVSYATVDGTARAGSDYQAVSNTLSFAPGETVRTISVSVLDDAVLEPEEAFYVDLSNPVGASLDRGRGKAVIRDDERCEGPNLILNPGAELPSPPVLGLTLLPGWTAVGASWQQRTSDPAPFEGLAYFSAGATDHAELIQDVPVIGYAPRIDAGGQAFVFRGRVRTRAESPSDLARIVVEYRDATNSVVLDAFDTGEIASPTGWTPVQSERTAPAGTRFVRVRLLASRVTGTADDGYFDNLSLASLRAPVLTIPDVTIYEILTGAEAKFVVTLSCPVAQSLSVAYATADGTATAGSDYVATSGTLSFPAGSVAATISVPVLGDAAHERHETFYVNLSSPLPAGETVLADPQGLGLIVNDDFCPRSPGFWKTHTEVWPATSLVLGGRRYGAAEMSSFLAYNGPDASKHLARQLVATKLNLLVGSPPSILPVVDAADALLALFPPGSNPKGADKARADVIKNLLDAYNNSSCVEVPVLPDRK